MRPLKTLFLMTALAATGCAKDESSSDSGGGGGDGGQDCSADGAVVFLSCAGCHGPDGVSGSAPDLAAGVPSLSDDALMDILMNGVGSMAAPNLNECEEDALFTYLRDTFGEEGGG